jgi:DNA-binding response OmpR family regulator
MAQRAPILVADDDDNDIFFLRRALAKAGLSIEIVVAHDGQEVMDYLSGQDRDRFPLPRLLLLDLKMPRLDGFDVLAWRQRHPEFSALPVVVLSSSAHEADRQRACQLGADDYFIKPSDFQKLVVMIKELHDRWLKDPVAEEETA